MYSFWESISLRAMTYKGNPWEYTFRSMKYRLWNRNISTDGLELWRTTIEENFVGENADMAIYKSENIAKLMAFKMELARRL
jgi:hemoglobin